MQQEPLDVFPTLEAPGNDHHGIAGSAAKAPQI